MPDIVDHRHDAAGRICHRMLPAHDSIGYASMMPLCAFAYTFLSVSDATRARVLSLVFMMRSLAGTAMYATIGASLKMWSVQITLLILTGLVTGLIVLTTSAYYGLLYIRRQER
jgi:hypothetical protein